MCLPTQPLEHANISPPQAPGGGNDGLNIASEDKPQIEGEASTVVLSKQQVTKVYPRLKL